MAFVNNRWVLAGLTSNGFACALPNYLGIYTRVSAFIPFIDANANISVPETTPVSVTTLNNQTGSNGSQNNMIDKFIFILILSCILLFS
jgi:secreted trypsin-like serine protease